MTKKLLTIPALLSVITGVTLCLQCHPSTAGRSPVTMSVIAAAGAPTVFAPTAPTDERLLLAQSDPLEFLYYCRDSYAYRDYICTFTKQEFIKGALIKPQVIAVRFREKPFSIDMEWVKNAGQAERALYVEGAWTDNTGRELAWVKPSGALLKLVVPKIKQPIDGRRAKSASRRTVEQFGFKRTLDLIIKHTKKALDEGVLKLEYVGEGSVSGRPTFVFERHLPYNGMEEPYPDRLLRFHIDREWLVPSACYSYGDDDGEKLLGRYILTDVKFNVGFDDDDFDPDKIGF